MIYYVGQFIAFICMEIILLFSLGEKPCKKNNISLLLFPVLPILANHVVYNLFGDFIKNILFVLFYFFLPAVFFKILTKKKFFHICCAVLIAYMSGQLGWFAGELALRGSSSFTVSAIIYALVSVLFAVSLILSLRKYQLPFFNGSIQKTVEFASIPFLFFVFKYFTVLFPGFFYSDNQLTTQIMPTLISLFYFGYSIIYAKEISIEKKNIGALTHESIIALSNAVELNDFYTSGHSRRVAEYSKEIASRMNLSPFSVQEIYYAALLHDVGKIGIDNNIINKNGKLSEVEYKVMKNHPSMGFRLLTQMSKNTEYKRLSAGALSHHERYDGTGYPYGIAGEEIPLVARIIAVADTYDAMTSYRSYRDPLPQEKARAEIEKGLGTQFDPKVGKIMLQIIKEDKDYRLRQFSISENEENRLSETINETDSPETAFLEEL